MLKQAGIRTMTWLLCAVFILSGCGFKLRQARDYSQWLDSLYIEGASEYGELGSLLFASLRQNNVTILEQGLEQGGENALLLRIVHQGMTKRVISLDALGSPNQYELKLQLQYLLLDKQGQERLPQQTLSLRREFLYDSNQVLAKQQEESQLRHRMYQAMVEQLQRSLYHHLRQQATSAP